VSFIIRRGEVLGLVGESGCGKSVTAMSILRLIPRPPGRFTSGEILYNGRDLLTMPIHELRAIRGHEISMIFQEPMTALSPLKRVGRQMTELLRLHRPGLKKPQARAEVLTWLRNVGLPDPTERLHNYPFQLSGGMRQRVMIAMAIMLQPALIIADEPTTALDVTIQAQVFDLMLSMKTEATSLLLITHDMGVIWELCDRVIVMYASHIVEEAAKSDLFRDPKHPYTRGLLHAMPRLDEDMARLDAIEGQVPSPLHYPQGCNFQDRCPIAIDRCRAEVPPLHTLPDGRRVACFRAHETDVEEAGHASA
jgi:peptide/nickel transport system ATP-binding protein/oligopeptide transport system ATP-binding protein